MQEVLAFLIGNLMGFFILNLLLRFYLQVARVSFSHPLAQFTVRLTNFAVVPVRRLVPALGGYDTASLLLAWLCALVMHIVLVLLDGFPLAWASPVSVMVLGLLAVLELFRLSLYLLFAALLVQVILSWVQPVNPLSPLLNGLTRPVLRPLQKLIPPMGGLDLSPMVALLIIEVMQRFVVVGLEKTLKQQLVLFG